MTFPAPLSADMIERFALAYRDGKHTPPNRHAREAMNYWTMRWLSLIPLRVVWCKAEPYDNYESMCRDIDRGIFRMKDYAAAGYRSVVFGEAYPYFRAVHDYWAHYIGKQPFGIVGELGSYGVHTGQFPPETWPMIFNELVLVNSYKDHFGEYSPEDKLVLL